MNVKCNMIEYKKAVRWHFNLALWAVIFPITFML